MLQRGQVRGSQKSQSFSSLISEPSSSSEKTLQSWAWCLKFIFFTTSSSASPSSPSSASGSSISLWADLGIIEKFSAFTDFPHPTNSPKHECISFPVFRQTNLNALCLPRGTFLWKSFASTTIILVWCCSKNNLMAMHPNILKSIMVWSVGRGASSSPTSVARRASPTIFVNSDLLQSPTKGMPIFFRPLYLASNEWKNT